jgi:ubiquinone/menaquinone biosynthesis C-methylase UbiE
VLRAFRLLYNEFAWTYDAVSWAVSLGQWRAWQLAALRFVPPGARVLELAHGTGHLQRALAAAGHPTAGLDLSPFMGRIARARARATGRSPRRGRGAARRLPFPAASFDALISTFPTEFIIQPATVAEIHRVLRPGGHCVWVPAALLTGGDAAARVLEWLYGVTGQRGATATAGPALLEPFRAGGFAARIEIVRLARSTVVVVVAEVRG